MSRFWAILPVRWSEDEKTARDLAELAVASGCGGIILAPKKPAAPMLAGEPRKRLHEFLDWCGSKNVQVGLDLADITKCDYGDPARVTIHRQIMADVGGLAPPAWKLADKRAVATVRCPQGYQHRLSFSLAAPALCTYRVLGRDDLRLAAKNLEAGEHSLDLWCPFGLPSNTGVAELTDMEIVLRFESEAQEPAQTRLSMVRNPSVPVASDAPAVRSKYPAEMFADWLPTWGDWRRCPRWESDSVRREARASVQWGCYEFAQSHPCVTTILVNDNEPRNIGWQGSFQSRFTSAGQGLADMLNFLHSALNEQCWTRLRRRVNFLSWGDPIFTQNATVAAPGVCPRGGGLTTTKQHLHLDRSAHFILWTGQPNPDQCETDLRDTVQFCADQGLGLYGGPGSQLCSETENLSWREAYRRCNRSAANVYLFDWMAGFPNWTVETLKRFMLVWMT